MFDTSTAYPGSETYPTGGQRSADRGPPEQDPVEAALGLTVPAWPLQNAVAVSPFWHLRHKDYTEVMAELATVLHTPLYMPLSYYLEKYHAGFISQESLTLALGEARARASFLPASTAEFIQLSKREGEPVPNFMTFAEALDRRRGTAWQKLVGDDVAKYAAAYFDQSQALARFPWQHLPFWQAWSTAVQYDRTLEAAGLGGFRQHCQHLQGVPAKAYVEQVLASLGLVSTLEKTRYLARIVATLFGWASQFRLAEWQRLLGLNPSQRVATIDLVAVRLAYDHALAKVTTTETSTAVGAWVETLRAPGPALQAKAFAREEVWQAAFELSHQQRVAAVFATGQPTTAMPAPRYHVVACIDVRSEVLRRHLEEASSDLETGGFAGFFGLPLRYHEEGVKRPANRLPVLLAPQFEVREESGKAPRLLLEQSRMFFRSLRKGSLSSFAYVELFGWTGAWKMLKLAAQAVLPKRLVPVVPTARRWELKALDGSELTLATKVERAAAALRGMGLNGRWARLVVLAGHGSKSRNNAFASALACGACGGHAGDVNARLLAWILNDLEVRAGLAALGTVVPETTHFVAALHETVTDSLHLLDQHLVPQSHLADVAAFTDVVRKASPKAAQERSAAGRGGLDAEPRRRASNWAELRPEWGLVGNASLVVAPRRLTRGADLAGRVFLHDYDWQKDEGFATLELIMTAPMVVANWINLQYYGSTVAPGTYGAGNKILHNLVGENGVLEGNGGDLRVGLPLQSVSHGEIFMHEPLRLSVFLAAPRVAIEGVIAKHPVVRELVDHGWLHLLQVDEAGVVARRLAAGAYRPL